jgi:hypothetical protein
MTDRLSLANALTDAKIDRPAAERIATEIFEAIHDSVASKADLQRLESATSADFQRLEAAIQRLEAATTADFQRLEAATTADFQRFEAATTAEFAAVRSEMALLEHRLLTRLGSLIVIVAGLLFAALRYLPPAH